MSAPEWVIGVILILIGTVGDNWGSNLVSLHHSELRKETKEEIEKIVDNSLLPEDAPHHLDEDITRIEEAHKPKVCSYRVLGSTVFILGNLMSFAAYGFGAQSLIAALESIYFVSNLVFVSYLHKEKITWQMGLATVSICAGNVLVVLFAEKEAEQTTSTGMMKLYEENNLYHIYLGIIFVVWLITLYIYNKYFHSRVHLNQLLWHHSFVEPFCFAVSSAIVGTQAVLNSKCMSMLIQVTIRGIKNEFADWYIYIMLVTWLLAVSFWLSRLDQGLKLYPPMFIIPVMQVFFMFFAILCGGIYFEEFLSFGPTQWGGFVAGIFCILAGVFGMTPHDMVLHTPLTQVKPCTEEQEKAAASAGTLAKDKDMSRGDIEMGGTTDVSMSCGPKKDGSGTELDATPMPMIKEKPKSFNGNLSIPPPENQDVDLYLKTESPTHFPAPLLNKKEFSNVKLEPITPSTVVSTSASTSKKNRKVVKRGNSSDQNSADYSGISHSDNFDSSIPIRAGSAVQQEEEEGLVNGAENA